jgi:hypothetical protein
VRVRASYTSHHERLAFRFATSVALGAAYGRRILDLKDEMVRFNHKSVFGEYIWTFLG